MKTQHLVSSEPKANSAPRSNRAPFLKRENNEMLRNELDFWEKNINSILVYRKTSPEIPKSRIVKRLLNNLNQNRDYYAIRKRMKKLKKHMEVKSGVIDLYGTYVELPLSLMGSVITVMSLLSHLG